MTNSQNVCWFHKNYKLSNQEKNFIYLLYFLEHTLTMNKKITKKSSNFHPFILHRGLVVVLLFSFLLF